MSYRGRRVGIPLLGDAGLRRATPCAARGDPHLIGCGRERYCWRCGRDVYDVASLSPEDARAVIGLAGTAPAPQLYVRDDGTVMTADCPLGVRRRRIQRWLGMSVWALLLAAPLALAWPPHLNDGPTEADFAAAARDPGVDRVACPFPAFRRPAFADVQGYGRIVCAGPVTPLPRGGETGQRAFRADRP